MAVAHRVGLCNPAGLPTQNDTTYCPYNQSSCYVWVSAGTSFDAVASKCTAAGGYLVSYGNASEQLQVGVPRSTDFLKLPHPNWLHVCISEKWYPVQLSG